VKPFLEGGGLGDPVGSTIGFVCSLEGKDRGR
jgi:hypothetical protein